MINSGALENALMNPTMKTSADFLNGTVPFELALIIVRLVNKKGGLHNLQACMGQVVASLSKAIQNMGPQSLR